MSAPRSTNDPHMRMNLDDIYTKISQLQKDVNAFSKGPVSQTQGKPGDIRVFVGADNKPYLAMRTDWGWAQSGAGIFSLEPDKGKEIAYVPSAAQSAAGFTITGGEARTQLVMDTALQASTLVDKSSTQTITGDKTFTGNVLIGEDGGTATFKIGNQTPGNEKANIVYVSGTSDRTFNIPLVAATSTFITTGNLSDVTTLPLIATYNSLTTAGFGLPVIVAAIDSSDFGDSGSVDITGTNVEGLYVLNALIETDYTEGTGNTATLTITWDHFLAGGDMSETLAATLDIERQTNKTITIHHKPVTGSYIRYAVTHTQADVEEWRVRIIASRMQ